jgi:polyphosphate kinase
MPPKRKKMIELQARFDEASNISYAEQMQTEGIELLFWNKRIARTVKFV